LKQGISP
jgi:hypothetical protein